MAGREARQPGVVVSIVGPTASGKTELAIALAQRLGTEVVNADARQVFRGMAIGTAQPTAAERAAVTHHLVDFLEPSQLYSAGLFEQDAVPLLERLCRERGCAVLAGGSGMYVMAALEGLDELPADLELRRQLNDEVETLGLPNLVSRLQVLDPDHTATMDTSNPQRVVRALEVCLTSGKPFSSFHTGSAKQRPWNVVKVGLDPNREELRHRIAVRAQSMMEAGWLEEAKALLPHRNTNALNTVGYKELFEHMDGTMTLDQAVDLIVTHTRQFAKRQRTWFRKDSDITWFGYDSLTRKAAFESAAEFVVTEVRRIHSSNDSTRES